MIKMPLKEINTALIWYVLFVHSQLYHFLLWICAKVVLEYNTNCCQLSMHASFAISSSSPTVFPNKSSGGIISVGGGELIDDENISKTFEAKEHSTERVNKEHTAERLIKTTKFCLKVDETNEYSSLRGL